MKFEGVAVEPIIRIADVSLSSDQQIRIVREANVQPGDAAWEAELFKVFYISSTLRRDEEGGGFRISRSVRERVSSTNGLNSDEPKSM
jgi:hypothetical protein